MKYIVSLLVLVSIQLSAFQTSNIQLLHSDDFDGNAYIYDTLDKKKTTITLEHYRTWEYGDLFMFADIMSGKKFDGTSSGIYFEAAPRFSLSKLTNSDLSMGIIQDVYISTQVNIGRSYQAYLYGAGINLDIPGFNFFSIDAYHKNENIYDTSTYQVMFVYESKPIYKVHFEGFIDKTRRDIGTHNRLLYNVDSKAKFYVGFEWIYYKYDNGGFNAKTSVLQAMVKYKF